MHFVAMALLALSLLVPRHHPHVRHDHFTYRKVLHAREFRRRPLHHLRAVVHPASPGSNPAQRLMLSLVNVDREQHGIAPLRLSPHLSRIASWRASDMRDRHYFAHLIPGLHGCYVFCVMTWQGISYTTAGENIIYSNAHLIAPMAQVIADFNTWWMHSPEHRRNILDPSFTHIGIGFALAPGGYIYGVEDFTG